MNPLLLRHLYSSARKNRFFVLLSLYLLGVGVLALLFSLITTLPAFFDKQATISILDLFTQGRALYWYASAILLLTAGLLVPINALGAIAGERENRTLDLLVTTTLKPRDIVMGKVNAALMTGAIYVLAPLPLLMTGFWLGGVTTTELILTLLLLGLTMALTITWAIFISTLTRKTIAAVILFYSVNFASIPIFGILIALFTWLHESWRYASIDVLPFWIETAIQYGWVILAGLHPASTAVLTEVMGLDQGTWVWLHFPVERIDSSGSFVTLGTATLPSPWLVYTISTIMTVSLLLWRTTRRLSRPKKS